MGLEQCFGMDNKNADPATETFDPAPVAALRNARERGGGSNARARRQAVWDAGSLAAANADLRPVVVPLLLDRLAQDKDTHVRAMAVTKLGTLGDGRAVAPLIEVLAEPKLRLSALEALGRLGARLAGAAVPAIAGLLSDPNDAVRSGCLHALGRLADASSGLHPALIAALASDSKATVRESAAKSLGVLLSSSDDSDTTARARTETAQALVQAFGDPSSHVRWYAAEALARIGRAAAGSGVGSGPNVAERMDALVRDRRTRQNARHLALVVLARLCAATQSRPAALHSLTALVRDGGGARDPATAADIRVRAAHAAVVRPGPATALGADAATWPAPVTAAEAPALVDALIGLLADENLDVREAALVALAYLPDAKQAALPLLNLLADPARTSHLACMALGWLGDRRAVEPLMAVLENDARDTAWQSAAADALGRLGDPRAVYALLHVLERPRPANAPDLSRHDPRVRAAEALGQLGDNRAADPLTRLTHDANEHVRLESCRALIRLHDPRGADGLVALLRDDLAAGGGGGGEMTREAIETLGQADEKAIAGVPVVETLLDLLPALWPSPGRGFPAALFTALGRRRDARAAEPLLAALLGAGPYPNPVGIRALGEIGGEPAVRALEILQQRCAENGWGDAFAAEIEQALRNAAPAPTPARRDTL